MAPNQPPGWQSYEEVTKDLMRRIGEVDGRTTVRLEHNVVLPGRATSNQIDVLWEVRDEGGGSVRFLFECRSYASRITQQALHSWRSVIDDVAEPGVETVGVMVTATGYQSGAMSVADTYGIVICELREPTEDDLAGRVQKVVINIIARHPSVSDLNVEAIELLGPGSLSSGQIGDYYLELADGSTDRLMDVMLRDELLPHGGPVTPTHEVVRSFDPPAILRRRDEPLARVRKISGIVSESESEPTTVTTEMERVTWMLANSLTGARIWFGASGKIWQTSS